MPRNRTANLVGTITGTSLNVASISLSSGLNVASQVNNAYAQANAAYGQANLAYTQSNNAYVQANNAYGQANLGYSQANSAYGQANLAYTAANTKLAAAGGTITGDLTVSGNLFVEGTTTTLNVSNLEIEDNDIVLNANTTGTPSLNATITIDRGTSTNTFLRWNENSDKWGWSDDGTTMYNFSTSLDAYGQANSAFDAANNRVLKAGDTMTGNLTFSGTGLRIIGDMSNATIANRMAFQTSTANSSTTVLVLPNGTGTNAQLLLRGGSDAANDSFGQIVLINNTEFRIATSNNLAGVLHPMTFYTGGSERMRLDTSGNIGIGGTPASNDKVLIAGTLPATANSTRVLPVRGTIPSTALQDCYVFESNPSTQAATFTLNNIQHFRAGGVTLGANSAIGTQYGFIVPSVFAVANANNYGFFSNIASGENRWNFYANGTADNYFAGNVGIGTASPNQLLHIEKSQNSLTGINIYNANAGGSASAGVYMRNITSGSSSGGGAYLSLSSGNVLSLWNEFGNPITFGTNGTQRMQIDGSGNVGIGTTPSYKLHVYSATNNRATFETGSGGGVNYLRLLSGTGGGNYGSSIEFNDGATNSAAINSVASGELRFATSGTEKLTITSGGNVGIGTTSPTSKLDVYTATASGGHSPLFFSANNSSSVKTNYVQLGFTVEQGLAGSETGGFSVKALRNNSLVNLCTFEGAATVQAWKFFTEGTERLRIDTNGNVGVGTTSIAAKLHVHNTNFGTGTVASLWQYSGSASSPTEVSDWPYPVLSLRSYGNFYLQTMLSFGLPNDADYKTDDSSWNFRLNGVTASGWDNNSNTTPSIGSSANVGLQLLGPGNLRLGTVNAKNIFFRTNNIDQVTIDSSGNVGIGRTPAASTRLTIKGQNNGTGTFSVYVENSTPTEMFKIRDDGTFYTGVAGNSPYNLTTGSAANVFVDTDGILRRSTSSLRYKTNVVDAAHGLADVLKLRSVTYKGKNDGDKVFGGLIAEEVHDAGLTEFVAYDNEGRPDALHYGNMVALLTKAIQELKVELDEAKAEIATLKSQ